MTTHALELFYYWVNYAPITRGTSDVGDRYKLTFGGDYAFPGGRGSSAGKPRIPPGADIDYEVQIIELPGKGEDMIADVDDDIVE